MILVMKAIPKRSRTKRLIFFSRISMAHVLILMLAMGLGGCENQKRPVKEPVVTKQIAASSKVIGNDQTGTTLVARKADTSPQAVTETASTPKPVRMPYNPIGKVDPFAPLYKDETENKPQAVVAKPKAPERPRTPLEKLDLGQLKLTAIVTAQNEKRALVEEASGKGYVVEIGTRIGLERGSVVEIGQDRILIEHSAEDDFGKATSRKRELKLQKPPGD